MIGDKLFGLPSAEAFVETRLLNCSLIEATLSVFAGTLHGGIDVLALNGPCVV